MTVRDRVTWLLTMTESPDTWRTLHFRTLHAATEFGLVLIFCLFEVSRDRREKRQLWCHNNRIARAWCHCLTHR